MYKISTPPSRLRMPQPDTQYIAPLSSPHQGQKHTFCTSSLSGLHKFIVVPWSFRVCFFPEQDEILPYSKLASPNLTPTLANLSTLRLYVLFCNSLPS